MWRIIMPNYTLKHKDHNLCTFALNRHQIDYAAFKKASLNELPLPLWLVFNYKEEFIGILKEFNIDNAVVDWKEIKVYRIPFYNWKKRFVKFVKKIKN